jgi:hypothetical protein
VGCESDWCNYRVICQEHESVCFLGNLRLQMADFGEPFAWLLKLFVEIIIEKTNGPPVFDRLIEEEDSEFERV